MDKKEIEETLQEIVEWKESKEKDEEVRHRVESAIRLRCSAVTAAILGALAWIGGLAADNFEVIQAMIRAAIKAKSGGE